MNINLIKDIVLKSYQLIPNNFMTINIMILRYIPILAVTLFAKHYLRSLAKPMSSDYTSFWVHGLTIINFMAQITISLVITRMIMFHEHPGDNYYKTIFSKMNFKMIGFMVLFISLMLVLVGVAGGIFGLATIPTQSNMQHAMLIFVGTVIIGLGTLYIVLKIALVPQIIAVESKIGIRQSFMMMKGQTLNLIMIFIVVFIPIIIVAILNFVLMFKYLSVYLIQNVMHHEGTDVWLQGIMQIMLVYLAVIPNAAQTYLYKNLKERTLLQ